MEKGRKDGKVYNPLRVFGRKRALTQHQKGLWERSMQTVLLQPEDESDLNDFAKDLHTKQSVHMEIGLGYGEHFIRLLSKHSEGFCIGVEPYQYGCLRTFCQLNPADYQRVRLVCDNVWSLLFPLPSDIVDTVFLLHPDPWPKSRHQKRRVFSGAFLQACARCLKPGGKLFVATDHAVYQDWVQEHMDNSGHGWGIKKTPWPDHWPLTRYGLKALSQNRQTLLWTWEKLSCPDRLA